MNVARLFQYSGTGAALVLGSTPPGVTRFSHEQLQSNVRRLSESLQRLGIRRGDRILVLCTTSAAALEIILAAFRAGATAMPLNPMLGEAAIAEIAARMQPSACFHEDPLRPRTEAALQSTCGILISLRPLAPGHPERQHAFASLLEGPETASDPVEVDPEDPALVIHTSGSRGVPQTIVMTHARMKAYLTHNAFLFSQFLDGNTEVIGAVGTTMVSVLPFSHLGGLGTCLVTLLRAGTLYLPGPFVPRTYLAALEESKCRCISLVPSMYRSLLKDASLSRTDLSNLRFCITLGEPCPAELVQQIATAFGATLASAYGLTECLTGIGHMREDLLSGRKKSESCGTLCFGEFRLVTDSGADSDTYGELWVRNSTVSDCYMEERLNEAWLENGWFKTRDLFFRDAEGYFFHRGRCDEMFTCNGKNIYPAEVESLLVTHPLVDAACAAAVLSEKKGTIPAVLVVAQAQTTAESIINFAARLGPAHAVPQFVQFVPALPQVGPGKLDRVAAAKILQHSFDGEARATRSPPA